MPRPLYDRALITGGSMNSGNQHPGDDNHDSFQMDEPSIVAPKRKSPKGQMSAATIGDPMTDGMARRPRKSKKKGM